MNRKERRAAKKREHSLKAPNALRKAGQLSSQDLASLLSQSVDAHRRGDIEKAVKGYRALINTGLAAMPVASAHSNLASLLRSSGRSEEAEKHLRSCLRIMPSNDAALTNLGNLYASVGRPELSRHAQRIASAVMPGSALIADNLGLTYERAGQHREAAICYRRAILADPAYAEAAINLGNCLRVLGQVDEAVMTFHKAFAAAPWNARGLASLASALWDIGRLEDALRYFHKALAIEPLRNAARSAMLFAYCFTDLSPQIVYEHHRRFDYLHGAPSSARPANPHGQDDPKRPLRIGYVSSDLRWHPGGHFLSPHLMHHDTTQTEVYCYYTGGIVDEVTTLLKKQQVTWRDVAHVDDSQLLRQIEADRIDILVDCMGHLAHNRLTLFARRVAPLQMSFPLYPATTGLSAMDYRLGDPYFAPQGCETYHSEAIVRMPHTHVCYEPVRVPIAPAHPPPYQLNGHVTFGCFNHIAKVNRDTLETWGRILAAAPSARLHLKWRGLDGSIQHRLMNVLEGQGAARRQVDFIGWAPNPYSPYRNIDVALDPLGKNGGTTTCDALWMGVPVLTAVGETPFSRVGLCHLTAAGMPKMIADNIETYVQKAVELATRPAQIDELRYGLRDRAAASALMDSKRYAAELDWAYRHMWQRHCLGLRPASFHVPLGGQKN